MDGRAHGETPRLVAFESRLLGGQRNRAWEPPPPKPVEEWPELPPGREYILNEQGEVVGIQATEDEHRRLMAEARRQWEAAEAERLAKLPVYPLPGDSKIKTAEVGVTELPGIFQAKLNDFYRKRKAENHKLERAPYPGELPGDLPIDQLNPIQPELELSVELRTENQNRTVLELFQFLNFIEHATCQYALWRDKAGYNGFRPIRFKHELDEIPKRLRQWERTVALIQENLELWPNIVRLRTLAEAEGKGLTADWFRQWKARRAIELGLDSVDDKRLSEVVGGTVTPLEVGSVAVESVANNEKREATTGNTYQRLLSALTNGASNEKLQQMVNVIDGSGTVDQKTTELDKLLPLVSLSADKIAKLLGCKKQAVLKTSYWKESRAGKKDEESETRRQRMTERGRHYETGIDDD